MITMSKISVFLFTEEYDYLILLLKERNIRKKNKNKILYYDIKSIYYIRQW